MIRGAELFRSLTDPHRYLTVDRFADGSSWESFQADHGAAYRRLGDATEGPTTEQRELA